MYRAFVNQALGNRLKEGVENLCGHFATVTEVHWFFSIVQIRVIRLRHAYMLV